MNTDSSQYPCALRHFGLDKYIDSTTTGFMRLRSERVGSYEAQVNHVLSKIEEKQGQHGYPSNRLREKVSCIVFAILMGFPLPELSTVVNDIWFKVDAIGKVGEQLFAIDFTEDISLAPQKLDSIGSDGNRDIIGEAGQKISLPFIVVTIASMLVDNILLELEKMLTENPTIKLYGPEGHITEYVEGFFKKDSRPDLVFDIHMGSRGELHDQIAVLYGQRMTQMSK